VRQNKIGHGNGEAKLYIGHDSEALVDFFGERGFGLQCFLLRDDLLRYLDETKTEYLHPEQPYIHQEQLPSLWSERYDSIQKLPEIIPFESSDQVQIDGSRVYIKSKERAYALIRELSLPNITYIAIVKLRSNDGSIQYYFKLFADYFGEVVHPFLIEKQEEDIRELATADQVNNLSSARKGQGKYREGLLHQCPYCPITMVSDERILIASHIKPWAYSDENEKIDPYNGFMFTPTFDYLFDRGFLSFTDDKRTILSPFLSRMTYSKLRISDNRIIESLPIEGREEYLEYHRKNIFQGILP